MSRGSPTFTDRSRAMRVRLGPLAAATASRPSGARSWLFPGKHLVDGEFAIGTVRNHRLTRLEAERGPVELERDHVRLERHQVGDAADFGIGLTIRPCRPTCVTDVVVAAEPLVRAERLMLDGGQR